MKSVKIEEFAANVHFLSFKKGGKIQTGLNCEYDGLSEACLSFSHSSKTFPQKVTVGQKVFSFWFHIQTTN